MNSFRDWWDPLIGICQRYFDVQCLRELFRTPTFSSLGCMKSTIFSSFHCFGSAQKVSFCWTSLKTFSSIFQSFISLSRTPSTAEFVSLLLSITRLYISLHLRLGQLFDWEWQVDPNPNGYVIGFWMIVKSCKLIKQRSSVCIFVCTLCAGQLLVWLCQTLRVNLINSTRDLYCLLSKYISFDDSFNW